MLKVLILTVCTGQGHNQVAASIMNRLREEENISCKIVDVFNYISPILGKSLSEGYLLATKYAPTKYGFMYSKAERVPDTGSSLYSILDRLVSRKLNHLFSYEDPDIIICTHVFAAKLLGRFGRQLSGITKIGVVTDYTLHPFWEQTILDYIIVPSDNVVEEAIKKGISRDKLLPLGMPVNEKFSYKLDKETARNLLGVKNKSTILVMSGSMGFGSIDEVIMNLDGINLDFQILCICGNNLEMKEKIEGLKTGKKVYSYGFVNNVEVFMDASDCIITKPGGITVSECLVKNLPMILVNPIPGQEERNAEYLSGAGAAIAINEEISIEQALESFLNSPEVKTKMLENIRNIAKPNAVENICSLVKEQASRFLLSTYQ